MGMTKAMGMLKDMDIHGSGHRHVHRYMNRNTNLERGVNVDKMDSTNNFNSEICTPHRESCSFISRLCILKVLIHCMLLSGGSESLTIWQDSQETAGKTARQDVWDRTTRKWPEGLQNWRQNNWDRKGTGWFNRTAKTGLLVQDNWAG